MAPPPDDVPSLDADVPPSSDVDAATTKTLWSALDAAPASSVTVRRTVKLPAAAGVAVTAAASSAPFNAVTTPPPDSSDHA
jgi:hypothetical protein